VSAVLTDAEWDRIETAHRALARSKTFSGDPLCGVIEEVLTQRLAAAAPTVERVEALCRLLVDEGHMTAEGQRQVVALWGAL